jgi:hypothetical protein
VFKGAAEQQREPGCGHRALPEHPRVGEEDSPGACSLAPASGTPPRRRGGLLRIDRELGQVRLRAQQGKHGFVDRHRVGGAGAARAAGRVAHLPHRPPQLASRSLQSHRGEVAQPVPARELPAVRSDSAPVWEAVRACFRFDGSVCRCAGSSGAGLRCAGSVRQSRPSALRARGERRRRLFDDPAGFSSRLPAISCAPSPPSSVARRHRPSAGLARPQRASGPRNRCSPPPLTSPTSLGGGKRVVTTRRAPESGR